MNMYMTMLSWKMLNWYRKLLKLHLGIRFLKSGPIKWTLICPYPNGQFHILGGGGSERLPGWMVWQCLFTGLKWSQAGQDQSERHKKGSAASSFTSFNQPRTYLQV